MRDGCHCVVARGVLGKGSTVGQGRKQDIGTIIELTLIVLRNTIFLKYQNLFS